MAGANETPRQKMMGILYLVLLGLAATTITDKVLNSFRNLSVGLEASTSNVQSTIDKTFAGFSAGALKDDPIRNKPFWDRAQNVKAAVDELEKTLASIKGEFEKDGAGFNEELNDYNKREDIDISPRIMIERHKAEELKKKIEETKAKILAQLGPEAANFKMALNADDPKKRPGETQKTWADAFFGDGIPVTAAMTALTKIEADVRTTESEAIKKSLGDSKNTELILDQYQAIAVPNSNYVIQGQPYSAEVFLTAFSNSLNPEITVGGQKLSVSGGKGLYTVNTSHEGEFKWSATLRMKKADGSNGEWKTAEMTYRVAKPSATASAEKMKVFYMGVPNPLSVSAPGIAAEKLKVSISAGDVKPGATKGTYDVFVKARGMVTVTISGDDGSGKTIKLSESQFKCKSIPNPTPTFGGKPFGGLPKAQLGGADRIYAVNSPDFDFDAKFEVTHFILFVKRPRAEPKKFESTSKMLTPEMKGELGSAPAGTQLIFDEITVLAPDGGKRILAPMVMNVQ